jgi:hypothetical protein
MTLKFTIQQAEAFKLLIEDLALEQAPIGMDEKLLQIMMIKIFKKIRNKTEARIKGDGYSISVNDEEAISYFLFFHDRYLGENRIYEASFIGAHMRQIEQAYA